MAISRFLNMIHTEPVKHVVDSHTGAYDPKRENAQFLKVSSGQAGLVRPFHTFRRSVELVFCVCFSVSVLATQTSAASDPIPEDHRLLCHHSAADGKTGAWSPWISNAKRNARGRWRRTVRPQLGFDYKNWGWADRELGNCGATGYCCRSKRIGGVTWHGCSASAVPCTVLPLEDDQSPRRAASPPPRAAPLEVYDVGLKAVIVNPGRCPRRVALLVTLIGRGNTGKVEFDLLGEASPRRVLLDLNDFERQNDGTLIAKYELHRVFDQRVNRSYRLRIVTGRPRNDPPRRMNPVKVAVDCLSAGGGTFAPVPRLGD